MFDTFILNDTDIAGSPFIQRAMEMIILRFCKLPGLWQAMVNCDRLLKAHFFSSTWTNRIKLQSRMQMESNSCIEVRHILMSPQVCIRHAHLLPCYLLILCLDCIRMHEAFRVVHRKAWPHAQEFFAQATLIFGVLSPLVCVVVIAPPIIFGPLLGRNNFFWEMAFAEMSLGCQGQNSDTRIAKCPVPVALLN